MAEYQMQELTLPNDMSCIYIDGKRGEVTTLP